MEVTLLRDVSLFQQPNGQHGRNDDPFSDAQACTCNAFAGAPLAQHGPSAELDYDDVPDTELDALAWVP
jgi:hypothetical protein